MTAAGFVYVANFGSNNVSVIDSHTNTVVDTINARTGPADVTITSRARPLALRYKFLPIPPPASVFSTVRALNSYGDAVGDYFDANWGGHGFLRTRDGVFTTIDPPGSTATSAFAVNDFGVIVGAFIDASGILHGFQRSSSGAYTTKDFPGAPDAQLTGINNSGEIAGAYDLGNRASTRCPGPSCQAFSFLLRSGQFTAFSDPAADPSLTFAFSINNQGQIAGLFRDPAGNIKGFIRNADGSFRNVQFPMADAFTYLEQINDLGIAAGEYSITFSQGFLTNGTHYLSLDYPDSEASGLRAVNNRGEVGGFFSMRDGAIRAYIARAEE
jgi:YVTN family beta-propeller protein